MPKASFLECIAFERGNEPFREPFGGATNVIRRRLLHGERLTSEQVSEFTGKTPGLLDTTVSVMKKWGFTFAVDGKGRQRGFRLTNPQHQPTEANRPERSAPTRRRKRQTAEPTPQIEPLSERRRHRETDLPGTPRTVEEYRAMKEAEPGEALAVPEAAATPEAAFETMSAELMPPPQLDQNLTVYMVYRDPIDGHVKLGIRNGDKAWLAVVEGHVSLEDLRS